MIRATKDLYKLCISMIRAAQDERKSYFIFLDSFLLLSLLALNTNESSRLFYFSYGFVRELLDSIKHHLYQGIRFIVFETSAILCI